MRTLQKLSREAAEGRSVQLAVLAVLETCLLEYCSLSPSSHIMSAILTLLYAPLLTPCRVGFLVSEIKTWERGMA